MKQPKKTRDPKRPRALPDDCYDGPDAVTPFVTLWRPRKVRVWATRTDTTEAAEPEQVTLPLPPPSCDEVEG